MRKLLNSSDFSNLRLHAEFLARSESGGQLINLAEYFQRSHIQNATPLRAARAQIPDGVDYHQVTRENKMPVIIVPTTEAGWYGITAPVASGRTKNGLIPGSIDLAVGKMTLISDKNERPVMVVHVIPRRIALQNADGSSVVHSFDQAQGTASAWTLSEEDILGARLGMKANEAIQMLKEELGSNFALTTFTGQDTTFDTGFALSKLDQNERIENYVALYTATTDPASPVIGISSVRSFGQGVNDEAITRALIRKYGEPAYSSGSSLVWISDENSRKRIANNISGSGCVIAPQRNLYLPNRAPIGHRSRNGDGLNLGEMDRPCGIVLNAYINDGAAALILIDTDRAAEFVAARNEALKQAKIAQKEKAAPEIKF